MLDEQDDGPDPSDSLRNLRIANIDGAFATAFVILTSGAFLVGYIKMLGASDFWIGLLGALPSLVGILQIPGGVAGRRLSYYKSFVAKGGLAWRLLYIPLVALPLVTLPTPVALLILTICMGVAWACNAFVSPIYNEWLSEVVPENSRGYYFSRRNARMAATGAAVGIAGGLILDGFKNAGDEPVGYATVFGLGLVCAAVSMIFFWRMDDLERPNPVRQTLSQGVAALKIPFADKQYRKVLWFLAVFVLGQMFAGNFFSAFAIEQLHMPFTIVQSFVVTHAIGNVLSAPMWGAFSDRFGNKPALLISGLGIALTPAPWLLCVPGDHLRNGAILIVLHLFSGAMWGGVILSQFNLILATSPREDRSTYIGAAFAVQAIIGGLSPLLGGVLMEIIRGRVSDFNAYAILFFANAALRALAMLALRPVREEGATAVRHAIKVIRRTKASKRSGRR